MKLYGMLAAATLALAACAGPQTAEAPPAGVPIVSAVEVSGDLSAVGTRDAARFWGNLGPDLESAIAQEFFGQTGPGGLRVAVDIDELSLAGLLAGQGSDARLTGRVVVTDPVAEAASGVYTVSASASQAMQIMGVEPGQRVQVVPATNEQFYQAVVSAFARGVADVVRGGGTMTPTG